jgi:hypothetical protein
MIKVLTGLVAAAVVLYGIVSFSQQSRIDALEKSKDRGKITWHAELAKAKGQREVLISASLVDYAVPRNLDEAFAYHDLVLAEMVSSNSFSADRDIRTWYKFRLIETLSTRTANCSTCPTPDEPPSELLPLNEGEFLLSQFGGEVSIDGVKVVSKNSQFPAFERGTKYLIFLSFDSNRIVASAPMGPWGTFISGADEKIQAIDNKLIHGLRSELSNRFNDSLISLRTHLKKNERAPKLN